MNISGDVLEDLTTELYVFVTFADFIEVFDTVDHNILMKRIKSDYVVGGKALKWFKSYLCNRSYKVKTNDTLTYAQSLAFGGPQGYIFKPILY